MKFASDLLFRFARSAPGGGLLDGTEGEFAIGTELAPIISIPGPQTDLAGFSATLIQRESWQASVSLATPASTAAQTSLLATLGRGLWQIVLVLNYFSDFNNSGASSSGAQAQLLDDDGTLSVLMRAFNSANVGQHQVMRFDILLPEDGWQLRLATDATGVAQATFAALSAVTNRLT